MGSFPTDTSLAVGARGGEDRTGGAGHGHGEGKQETKETRAGWWGRKFWRSPSCPAAKCWEWESRDVFLNCPIEKPLKRTPVHILVFRESFFSAPFPNLVKPPHTESVCQYMRRHSCTPSHTTNSLQVMLSESHLGNREKTPPSLNRNHSTKSKMLPHYASEDLPLEALTGCSWERQRLQTEPDQKEKKINPSRTRKLNFIRQQMLPPAA